MWPNGTCRYCADLTYGHEAARRLDPTLRHSGYVMVVYGKEIVVIDRPNFGHKFVVSDAWSVRPQRS